MTVKNGNGVHGVQDEINGDLRRDIRHGVYAPGDRLPARTKLQKQYKTTPVTVQRAFDKLTADGFVRSEGPRGTFVADKPPCLANYAIVYPSDFVTDRPGINFWRVLADVAGRKAGESDLCFSLYKNLNGHTDEPDYRRLLADVQAERLAGILFASPAFKLEGTPLFAEIKSRRDVPRVAFSSRKDDPDIPSVTARKTDALRQVFDSFAERGVKRLAMLSAMARDEQRGRIPNEAELLAAAAKRGIDVRPEHIQVMHSSLAARARQLTHLLLSGSKQRRPDGLLIVDDALVDAAAKGVLDAGRKPADLTVIAHCNFPQVPATDVPMALYGFDVSVFLETCLDVMAAQARGETVPSITRVPAQFCRESEWKTT